MFNIDEIKDLIYTLENSHLNKLHLKLNDNSELLLEKDSATVTATPAATEKASTIPAAQNVSPAANINDNVDEICSPMVGTFYSSAEPDTASFVEVGSKVHPNTIICILESMKLFSEIEAEKEGEIVEVLVKDGDFIEYGQPLFKIKTY